VGLLVSNYPYTLSHAGHAVRGCILDNFLRYCAIRHGVGLLGSNCGVVTRDKALFVTLNVFEGVQTAGQM